MSSFRFKSFTKPKKSAISKTSEREFDREVKKLETLDESTKKIQEDMKRCIKSQTAQAKFEVDIVQNMQNNALSREDEKLREICDHWSQSVKQLELQMEELNATSRRSIVDPMKKFSTIFPAVQQATRKREQSLQEYTNRQEKVEKYLKRERTGPNVVKLENSRKACAIAKMDFDSQNSILMDEVPRLYEGRIAYFQPSLQALIKAQIKYYTDSQETYSKLCKQLDSSSSSPTQDPVQLRQNIQQKLTEIRALSIAVDDQAK